MLEDTMITHLLVALLQVWIGTQDGLKTLDPNDHGMNIEDVGQSIDDQIRAVWGSGVE